MINIFILSLKDFWTKKFILLSILPLFLSVVVFSLSLTFAVSEISGFMSNMFFGYIASYPIISEFLSLEVVQWLINAMLYVFGGYLVLVLSIFCALIIAGFLTPVVVSEINKRHYNIDINDRVKTSFVLKKMTVEFFKFIGILVACLPLFFIPFFHFLAAFIPFFYLYYKFLLIDVSSNILNQTKFSICYIEGGGLTFAIPCFVFYLLSLVPFVGLFFQLFFIIFLTHLAFRRYFKI